MGKNVYLVCGYDSYGGRSILYCSLDESKAKVYIIERMKNEDKPFVDKALKQISKYKTEFDTLAATIDALNKQDYSGRDEFIQKIKDKQNGLSKRISREEVVVHIDYNSDFEHQCRVHNIYITGIELDSETEFCIEDFI